MHPRHEALARRLTATLTDVSEEGYVYRVDLRLRPEGGAGQSAAFGGGFDRGARQMFAATCSRCGKETEVPFRPTNGKPVFIRDVARVEDGYKEVRSKAFLNGASAVTFEVQKQAGTAITPL